MPAVKEIFLGLYRNFVNRCYFQEAFGYQCVDAGYIEGTLGDDIGLYFYRKLKKRTLWPLTDKIESYNKNDLFDVIELLYDLVSKPLEGDYHSWDNCGWHYRTFDKAGGQQEFIAEINDILEEFDEGHRLSETGEIFTLQNSAGNRQLLNRSAQTHPYYNFDGQFKFGLPISLQKPKGDVIHTEFGQDFKFEENNQVGILSGAIYPNFCMDDLVRWADPNIRLKEYSQPEVKYGPDAWKHQSWTIIYNLCQTDKEKDFLQAYICKFAFPYKTPDKGKKRHILKLNSLKDKVPALIPQAWINWSSVSKDALNRMGYKDSNLPYRLDFVTFWENRNYVVMIDGIEHYAEKIGNRWDAKEEKYAARLKEDRLLRLQGWNVFRVGNWEVKEPTRLELVLDELRRFIGFESPPIPPPLDDEDIPF